MGLKPCSSLSSGDSWASYLTSLSFHFLITEVLPIIRNMSDNIIKGYGFVGIINRFALLLDKWVSYFCWMPPGLGIPHLLGELHSSLHSSRYKKVPQGLALLSFFAAPTIWLHFMWQPLHSLILLPLCAHHRFLSWLNIPRFCSHFLSDRFSTPWP